MYALNRKIFALKYSHVGLEKLDILVVYGSTVRQNMSLICNARLNKHLGATQTTDRKVTIDSSPINVCLCLRSLHNLLSRRFIKLRRAY